MHKVKWEMEAVIIVYAFRNIDSEEKREEKWTQKHSKVKGGISPAVRLLACLTAVWKEPLERDVEDARQKGTHR